MNLEIVTWALLDCCVSAVELVVDQPLQIVLPVTSDLNALHLMSTTARDQA